MGLPMKLKNLFKKKKLNVDEFGKLKQQTVDKTGKPVSDIPDSESTMLGRIDFKSGSRAFCCDNCNACVKRQDGKAVIIIATSLEGWDVNPEEFGRISACFDYTNDPTNNVAGLVVSLGYWVLRFVVKCGELKSLSPLSIVCDEKDLDIRFTRPQRPYEESEKDYLLSLVGNDIYLAILNNIKNIGVVQNEQKN